MKIPSRPDKPSRFALLKGAFFQRVSPTVVRVWRRGACEGCKQPISMHHCTIYCTDDGDPVRNGLWRVQEGPIPIEGYTTFKGSAHRCGLCLRNWREPAKEFAHREDGLRLPYRE